MKHGNTSRRQILKAAAATASAGAVGFPYIVPASALGKDGNVAPSNRLVLGAIGTGGQGRGNMGTLMAPDDVVCVAVCDVDEKHRNAARDSVNKHFGNNDCKAYNDYRELVARDDIDMVCVGTPDHWHALACIAAANAGKDIYCEKPLTNSIAEGRAVCEAVKRNNVVLQTGSQERSGGGARHACELIRNGRLGKLHTIRVNLPCDQDHHKEVYERRRGPAPIEPAPDGFDYDMWLGHTAKHPYSPWRSHFHWRFILDHGGGEMTDRGAHVMDLAGLAMGTDDTGPVKIKAKGKRHPDSVYDTFYEYEFECTYANGVKMIGHSSGDRGIKFEGENGWIFIKIHGGHLSASDESILHQEIGPDEIHLGRSPGHHANFLDCVRHRDTPVASAETGHRTASLCHLINIAMITGRTLDWNPEKEVVTNDESANELVSRPTRDIWRLI